VPSISVREADPSDVDLLVQLMGEFYSEAGYVLASEEAGAAFTSILADARLGRVWLGEMDDEPVGYLVMTLAFSMEFGGLRGFVDDFFVRASHRRAGLGQALLKAARESCIALGVRALVVEAGGQDHTARGLYARAGFQDHGHVLLSQALAAGLHRTS
jgi:GNAT superfamily N-acetyltransferase